MSCLMMGAIVSGVESKGRRGRVADPPLLVVDGARFFAYRSKTKRWNEQISWQTVYNIFKINRKVFAIDVE